MVQNTCGQEGTAALAAPGGDSGFFLTGLHHGAEHLRPSQPSPEAKGPTEPPASDSSGRDSPAASESASEDGGDDLLTGEDVLGGEDPSPGDTADAAGRSEGEDEVVESAQTARRAELESYLRELRGKAEPAGSAPALLPEDFGPMVQEILWDVKPSGGEQDWLTRARQEARDAAEARAAGGQRPAWMGVKAEDPKTQKALDEAIALEKRLREKQIEAAIVWREANPERYEAQRERRNSRMAKSAQRAIQAERRRRQRQARLQRALQVMDTQGKDDHAGRNAALGPGARFFRLLPEEEALVERLLEEGAGEGEPDSGATSREPICHPDRGGHGR
uniref:Uncharacterized protein n=1 Tax=Tetraselmis sp. GSL018 TaxID=582737 RepID=A0A061QY07_9CHLO